MSSVGRLVLFWNILLSEVALEYIETCLSVITLWDQNVWLIKLTLDTTGVYVGPLSDMLGYVTVGRHIMTCISRSLALFPVLEGVFLYRRFVIMISA